MKNLANCRTLIKIGIMMVVVAIVLVQSQRNTWAKSNRQNDTDCDAWDKVITEGSDRFQLVMRGGDNVVVDKKTCLLWYQDPRTEAITWYDALKLSYNTKIADIKGWRVPKIEELATLADESQWPNPTTLPRSFPFLYEQTAWYWSSTTNADRETTAWVVGFSNGVINKAVSNKSNNLYVWFVRGGQGEDAK